MKRLYMEELYEIVKDFLIYRDELVPKFKKECDAHRSIKACPKYKEIHAICDALNAIAPYAGQRHIIPSELIGRTHGKK